MNNGTSLGGRRGPGPILRTGLVLAALAAFIAAVYLAVVVGLGGILGAGEFGRTVLSVLATSVVAVTFEPVRRRAEGLANRLLHGARATPYEILSRFSARVAETFAAEEALERMAAVIADGTGAARADVWLRIGSELVLAASRPEGPEGARVPLDGESLGRLPGADRTVAVRHQGELLGAFTIARRPGRFETPTEERLLADLGSQAGLVLRNVRLTTELALRFEELSTQAAELRASRRRIVDAQDAERRSLERDIHDGAQQHLVALAVKLRLARTLAAKDPERAATALADIRPAFGDALGTLRELARGIYPRVLAEAGIAEAVRARTAASILPVEVRAEGVGRHPEPIEAEVYFCCLEAHQNAVKHSAASRVTIRLDELDGLLAFSVADDGHGFDTTAPQRGSGLLNMSDRLAALGGVLEIRSAPGAGTTVEGRVPLGIQMPARGGR